MLEISDSLLQKIRQQARNAYPNECCGLLIGKAEGDRKLALDLRPQENAREDSLHNRYLIEPEAMLTAEKAARTARMDIVGVYHSHPDHPARPSDFDRDHAFPWYSYIIVNVTTGEPGDLTCWMLREDRSAFEPEEMRRVTQTTSATSV